MNIYVGNLPYKTQNDTLRATFEEFGKVDSVDIIIDRRTGRSRGYAFVSMPNDTEGSEAVESLNGAELEGRTLRVDISRPRDKDDNRPRRTHNNHNSSNQSAGDSQHQTAETAQKKSGAIAGFFKKIFG